MADKQVAQAKTLLQVHHEIEDLRLNRHIQCAHRLVGHDQRGAGNQSSGNGDALALPA